jgi:predicted RNase H-like HicB family nuclease
MSEANRRSPESADRAHAFASGDWVEGIRVHVHGHKIDLRPLSDGGWQAVVLDLPGCAAEGDSMVEAVATVAGAIAAWLETTEELERPSR